MGVESAGTTQLPTIDPIILIALEKDWSLSKPNNNKEFDKYIKNIAEKSTGIRARVIESGELKYIDDILDQYSDSYLVQGTVRSADDFNFNVYHNKDKIGSTNNFSEKEKRIVLILNEAIENFLKNNEKYVIEKTASSQN